MLILRNFLHISSMGTSNQSLEGVEGGRGGGKGGHDGGEGGQAGGGGGGQVGLRQKSLYPDLAGSGLAASAPSGDLE